MKKQLINKILEEYTPNELEDNDYFYHLKDIISKLPESDRILLILYTDQFSMGDLAKRLGVSAATICTNINRIRKQINEKMNEIC